MKTTRGITIVAAMTAIAFTAPSAFAQATKAATPAATTAKHETAAQLKKEAKVTEKAARATALAQVPGGKVRKHELERENGKLVYSFDIATKGKAGIDEVQIDAMDGSVVSNKHETPAMEKAEAKAEKKEAKAAKKKA
jgi:uncharacterized membrane protein YkoI